MNILDNESDNFHPENHKRGLDAALLSQRGPEGSIRCDPVAACGVNVGSRHVL